MRSIEPKRRSSCRVWNSSGEVVNAIRTLVFGTTSPAIDHRSSWETIAVASQSVRIVVSSRCRDIGLTETTMPPAFHVPTTTTRTCGMFCR